MTATLTEPDVTTEPAEPRQCEVGRPVGGLPVDVAEMLGLFVPCGRLAEFVLIARCETHDQEASVDVCDQHRQAAENGGVGCALGDTLTVAAVWPIGGGS
jgi:hypothetical protein